MGHSLQLVLLYERREAYIRRISIGRHGGCHEELDSGVPYGYIDIPGLQIIFAPYGYIDIPGDKVMINCKLDVLITFAGLDYVFSIVVTIERICSNASFFLGADLY